MYKYLELNNIWIYFYPIR